MGLLNEFFYFALGAAGHLNKNILWLALIWEFSDLSNPSLALNAAETLLGYWKGGLIKEFL